MKDPYDLDAGDEAGSVDTGEPVVIPIEDSLDLHAFQPREVKDLLDDYLESARGKGFVEVRIIHGKGTGTLRRRVLSILEKHPCVAAVRAAGPEEGGWGATVAILRGKPDRPANHR